MCEELHGARGRGRAEATWREIPFREIMAVEEFRKLAQRYSHRLLLLWGLVMVGGLSMLHYRHQKGLKSSCEQPAAGMVKVGCRAKRMPCPLNDAILRICFTLTSMPVFECNVMNALS